MIRRAIYGICGIAIALILIFLALPRLVDLDGFKPRIAAEFRKATGRTLALDGELDIDFVPYPRLAASDVRILNSGNDAAFELVTLKAFRLGVRLLPLLRGEIEISDIEMVEPRIGLERLPDGRGNWQAAAVGSPFDQPPAPSAGAQGILGTDGDLRINSLRIIDGTFSYRDAAGAVERIDGVTVDVAAGSLAGPFTVTGAMTVRRQAVSVDAYVGRHVEGEPLAVSLRAVSAGDTAALSAKGHIDLSGAGPRLLVDAALQGPGLGAFLALLPAPGLPAGFDHPFSLAATVDADEREARLSGMSVTLGGVSATGTATIPLGGSAATRIALDAGRLDVDALLGMVTPDDATEEAAHLPTDIDVEIKLAAEELVVARRPVRDLRVTASLRDGEFSVARLSARLPGEAAVELSGSADAHRGRLEYRGRLLLRASDTRSLLAWTGVDATSVAEDRLQRLSVRTEITGNLSEMRFTGIRGQLDASNLRGGVTLALSRRPSFGANLSVDQLNIDGYVGEAPAAPPAAAAGTSGEVAAHDRAGVLPAILGEFDANVELRVGVLGYRGTVASGVRLDGTLQDGALAIREASVRRLAGASIRFRGALTDRAGAPGASASLAAAADDPGPLLDLFGFDALAGIERPGPLRLSARAESVSDGLEIDSTLEIAGATLTVAGTGPSLGTLLAGSLDGGRELRFEAQHPDPGRLAALLGGIAESGAGEIRANVVATPADGSIGIRGEARFDGGSASVSGRILEPLASPGFDVEASLRHPDLVRLVQFFGFGPVEGDLGGVFLEAALAGNGEHFSIDRLAGSVGAVDIAGNGSYRLVEPRPRVELTLSAGLVPVDDFSGKSPPGAAPPDEAAPQEDTERWSRSAFESGLLRRFDSRIGLQARALLHKSLRIDTPRVAATLEDGVLSIEEMTGTISGGAFRATGALDVRDVPAARLSLAVEGAGIAAPLDEFAAFDIAGGELDLAVDLEARGRSEHEMVRTLDGSGRFSVRDGRVSGLDLDRIAEAVENHDPNLAALFERAMSGGETAFSALDGSFDLDRGILRVGTLGLRTPTMSADVTGRVDLPRWDVDLDAEYRLADPDDAPAFHMRLVGPPDRPRRILGLKDLLLWAIARGVDRVPETAASGEVTEEPARRPQAEEDGTELAPRAPEPSEPARSETASTPPEAKADAPGAVLAPTAEPLPGVAEKPPEAATPQVEDGAGTAPSKAAAAGRAVAPPMVQENPRVQERGQESPKLPPSPPAAAATSETKEASPTAPPEASVKASPDPEAAPEIPETAPPEVASGAAQEPVADVESPESAAQPGGGEAPQFDPDKLIRELLEDIR